MKIYLENPIEINGIKIGHTLEGLKYLINHYTHTMNIATREQLNDTDRAHCAKMIENFKIHVQLYENQKTLPAWTLNANAEN